MWSLLTSSAGMQTPLSVTMATVSIFALLYLTFLKKANLRTHGLAQQLDASPSMWGEKRSEGTLLVLPGLLLRTPFTHVK